MNSALFGQPAVQAVGWALLQFVWQGTVIGLAAAAALAALRRSAPDVRYLVGTVALAVMLTLPVVTALQRYSVITTHPAADAIAATPASGSHIETAPDATVARSTTTAVVPAAPAATQSAILRPERLLPMVMIVWLAGVTVLSLRLFTGWLWIRRMRTHGVVPADPSWDRIVQRLARQLHISRTIALLESMLVDVPTVIGWLTPVVLLPVSAIGGLAPQQLEAILAHELAHIRRHDYAVNVMQTLVETLLFYHPAVWWVSRRIRAERENCCDDLAVALCGDPIAYANALADLESLRSSIPRYRKLERTVLAATGGSLLQRVRRLLGAPSHAPAGPAWLAGTAALVVIACLAFSGDGLASAQQSPSTAQAEAARATPAQAAAQVQQETSALEAQAAAERKPALAATAVGDGVVAQARAAEAAAAVAVAVASTPSQSQSISVHHDTSSGNWSWSNGLEHLEVTYSGSSFDFTDDDADIRSMSPGGLFRISDGAWFGRHSVEIRDVNGQIEHHYYVNGAERPFEPEGRQWLHDHLPKFVRNTGIAAPSRVARLLKSGGPSAVLDEISKVDGAYVKGIYYRELFKQTSLTPAQYRQVLAQAGREMRGNDYTLAELLIAIADKLPNDEPSRDAYFTAASGLSSAYEMRRVYTEMLKRGPVGDQTLVGILDHVGTMNSDYDRSELLRAILSQQALDDRTRQPFFRAMGGLHSDYERHRVLSAALERSTDRATVEFVLTNAGNIGGDYDKSMLLQQVLKSSSIEGSLRAPFFAAANGLNSSYERGRVLQAVARRTDATDDTIRAVLDSARSMSGYDLSQVLITVAQSHALTGSLRDAYVQDADKLSGYDQGQVMTALVRAEKRR